MSDDSDSDRVVPIRPAPQDEPDPEHLLTCICGNQSHLLRMNGDIECASCGDIFDGDGRHWRKGLPDPKELGDEIDQRLLSQVIFHPIARINFLRKIEREEPAVIVALYIDGTIRTFNAPVDMSAPRRQGWLSEGFELALQQIMSRYRLPPDD